MLLDATGIMDLIDDLYRNLDLPWSRLEKMINQENNQSGLMLLALLLGMDIHALKNNSYILELIKDNSDILKAVNIFLQHMVNGSEYVSKIRAENNCLNDALSCGDLWKDLTALLILNGADPECVNGDNLTALAFYICLDFIYIFLDLV